MSWRDVAPFFFSRYATTTAMTDTWASFRSGVGGEVYEEQKKFLDRNFAGRHFPNRPPGERTSTGVRDRMYSCSFIMSAIKQLGDPKYTCKNLEESIREHEINRKQLASLKSIVARVEAELSKAELSPKSSKMKKKGRR